MNFVRQLNDALVAQEHEAWVDWKDIPLTAEWQQEIFANIETALATIGTEPSDPLQISLRLSVAQTPIGTPDSNDLGHRRRGLGFSLFVWIASHGSTASALHAR